VGSIVNGNTVIMPHDHVIVFCVSSTIRKMEIISIENDKRIQLQARIANNG